MAGGLVVLVAVVEAAFAEDRDIHAFVAAQVNNVSLDQVTREMRSRAKAVNFGIIYGHSFSITTFYVLIFI